MCLFIDVLIHAISGELCGRIDIRLDLLGSMCRVHLLIGKYLKNISHKSVKKIIKLLWKERKSSADLGRFSFERMPNYSF